MAQDKFYPDSREPHIHIHKGGITFTDTRHSHKKLQEGNLVRRAAVQQVIDDLTPLIIEPRIRDIVAWINKEF